MHDFITELLPERATSCRARYLLLVGTACGLHCHMAYPQNTLIFSFHRLELRVFADFWPRQAHVIISL